MQQSEIVDVVDLLALARRGDGDGERRTLRGPDADEDFVLAGREGGGDDVNAAREGFPVADIGLGTGGERGAEGHYAEADESGAAVVALGAVGGDAGAGGHGAGADDGFGFADG